MKVVIKKESKVLKASEINEGTRGFFVAKRECPCILTSDSYRSGKYRWRTLDSEFILGNRSIIEYSSIKYAVKDYLKAGYHVEYLETLSELADYLKEIS